MGVLSFVKFRFIDRRERSGGQASITPKKEKKKNIFVVAKTKKRVEKLFIGNIKLPGKIINNIVWSFPRILLWNKISSIKEEFH